MIKSFFCILLVSFFLSGCSMIDSGYNERQERKIKETLLVSAGNKNNIIEFYKKNLYVEPLYKVKLVELYLDMDDVSSAELYKNTYTNKELQLPEFIFSYAEILYKKKEYHLSKIELKRYVEKAGKDDKYYLLHGKILAQSGEYNKAIDDFEESRKVGVSDREASNNIAVVKMMQQDFSAANQILETLYRNYPIDVKVKSNYLLSLVHLKKFDIALEVLKTSHSEQQAVELLTALVGSADNSSSNLKRDRELRRCINAVLNPIPSNTQRKASRPTESTVNDMSSHKKKGASDQGVYSVFDSRNDLDDKRMVRNKIYRIQVLAANTKSYVSKKYISNLQKQYGDVYLYSSGGWRKYSVGNFSSAKEAIAYLKHVNVKGAFIVNNGHLHTKVGSK